MRRSHGRLIFAGAAAVFLWSFAARAFPTGTQFDSDSLSSAGGGQFHFTGGPSFPMGTCSSCHQNGDLTIGIRLNADDTSLFVDGYLPGNLYEMQVTIVGEHLGGNYNGPKRCGVIKGMNIPCNVNGFAIEATDVSGLNTGAFCPSSPNGSTCTRASGAPTILSMDATALHAAGQLEPDTAAGLPRGFDNGTASWKFYWTAPAIGTGPVTFHIGAVDGNGGEGTADVPQDIVGDDTSLVHVTVGEFGGAVPVATAGCALQKNRGSGAAAGAIAVLVLTMLVRRRKSQGEVSHAKCP